MMLFFSSWKLSPVCRCPSGHSLHSQACDHSCDQHPVCSWSPVVIFLSKELHLCPGLLEALACLAPCQLLSFWHFVSSTPFRASALETSCVTCQLIPDSFAHWGRDWRLEEEVKTGCFLLVSFLWPLTHQILAVTSTSCRDSGILFVLFFQHLLHPKQRYSASQRVTLKMCRSRPVEPLLWAQRSPSLRLSFSPTGLFLQACELQQVQFSRQPLWCRLLPSFVPTRHFSACLFYLFSYLVNSLNALLLTELIVQSLSCVRLFATLWTAARQASLSFTVSRSAQIHVHWVNDAIQPSHPLSAPSPAFSLSQHQGVSQWVVSSYQVTKPLQL